MTVQVKVPAAVAGALSQVADAAAIIDGPAFVRDFPGPAALYDASGRLLLSNALAGPLTDKHEVFLGEMGAIIGAAAKSGKPATHRLRGPAASGEGDCVFDLAIVPVGGDSQDRRSVLVLGRDSTFDVNLATALIASRRLFQDLVACSVDFAWETKSDGRFSFVSVRGALGYAAEELDGRPATELLIGEVEEGCVFESRVAVDDREIWLRHADGTAACMRVSATPVFDQNGEWLATRGVCRDITEAKMRDSALARAREREALIRGLVDTIRRVISPEEAYGAAVEQVAASTQADYAAIIRCDLAGSWRIVAEVRAAAVSLLDDAFLETEIEPDEEAMSLTVADDWKQVAVPCRYREELKGWLCIVRQAPLGAEDHTAELLATVAGHLGIAMAQADAQAKLERLSRIDELTGLLNRRAFRDAVQRRLAHYSRTGRTGALLFVDMDNFKAVNDVHGHQAGDDALRTLSAVLAGGDNRQSDIVARLGGDEFAMWLEETDREGARLRAERLLQGCGVLSKFSGSPDKPLSISVGVVVSQPDRAETLDGLIEQADEAMYRAKRGGKGRIVVVGSEEDDVAPC